MVLTVLIVVPDHATIVLPVNRRIDVGQVVSTHTAVGIDPDFPTQLAIATFAGDMVHIVGHLRFSQHAPYHSGTTAFLYATGLSRLLVPAITRSPQLGRVPLAGDRCRSK